MTDGKRLSRRELREQGKISVRPADGVDISETTELHLRRPSRKEMREARKAETGMIPAVQDETAEEQASEQKQPERLSVFDRFSEETKESEHDEPEEQTSEVEDAAEDTAEDAVEDDAKDSGSVTMRDRLLAMTRRQKAEEPVEEAPKDAVSEKEDGKDDDEEHADISRTSVMPADADLEVEELSQLVAPQEVVAEPEADSSVEDESKEMAHYEDDAPLSPRRTILNYILLILIAVLAGLLLGLLINTAFFSASAELVPAVPSVTELLL